MRNAIRSVSIALSAIGILSCSETIQSTSPIARRAMLSIAPQFDPSAQRTAALLSQVGIAFDHVRIIIVRPATDTLRDTTLAFQPSDTAKTLELAVLATPSDTLVATVQYVSGTSVLFQGAAPVVAVPVSAAATTTNTVSIAVTYTGPGATTTKIVVSPGTGTYGSGGPTQFSATAFDANNAQVANAPIVWSVSDTTVATITAATGVLTPKQTRGVVTVTAQVGTATSSVTVTLAPASARLRIVQGAAQIAAPGATLPLPVIIELDAADGLPASGAGLTVTFAATNGGSATPVSVALDANSRAQAVLKLGSNAGGIYLYTASVGSLSIEFSEIAVVGPPTQIIANGSTTITMTAGVAPTPIPQFRVADALGNSVAGVPLQATITLASPLTVQTTPVFVADTIGLGDLSAIASKLTRAGSYTITIGSPTVPAPFPALTYNVTVQPAAPASIAFFQGPTDVVANTAMSPSVVVVILDSFGNVTTSTANVTIALDGPSTANGVSATASTLVVAAVNGTATFSNLKFSPTGKTGVKLTASALGFSVLSTAFAIK